MIREDSVVEGFEKNIVKMSKPWNGAQTNHGISIVGDIQNMIHQNPEQLGPTYKSGLSVDLSGNL